MKLPFGEFREKLKAPASESNNKYYMQHYLGGLKQLDLRKVLTDSDGKIIDGILSSYYNDIFYLLLKSLDDMYI